MFTVTELISESSVLVFFCALLDPALDAYLFCYVALRDLLASNTTVPNADPSRCPVLSCV